MTSIKGGNGIFEERLQRFSNTPALLFEEIYNVLVETIILEWMIPAYMSVDTRIEACMRNESCPQSFRRAKWMI
jgi:hypothetical protein